MLNMNLAYVTEYYEWNISYQSGTQVSANGGAKPIVEGTSALASPSLYYYWHTSLSSEQAARVVLDLDGIREVLNTLRKFPEDCDIVVPCCKCLWSILTQSESCHCVNEMICNFLIICTHHQPKCCMCEQHIVLFQDIALELYLWKMLWRLCVWQQRHTCRTAQWWSLCVQPCRPWPYKVG